MKSVRERINGWQVWLEPLYRAWIATVSALIFGLAPILCAWITFLVRGEFRSQYASTLANGDALMIATSLAGPALILSFKKREPDTLLVPQLVALVGIVLIVACVVVFMNASPKSVLSGSPLEQQRVLICTYILLTLSVLYALWISYIDERCLTLKEFQRTVDANGKGLNIKFPGGGTQ